MKTYDYIILHLLKNPGQKLSINQIAKKLNKAPSGVFRELGKMHADNIALSEKIGNSVIYRLNAANTEARRLAEIALIKEKKERLKQSPYLSVLSKDLEAFGKYSEILALFGSAVRKKEFRDIDVFIVAKGKFVKDIEALAGKLSQRYEKNISPLIVTRTDFIENIKSRDEVILEIVKSGIVLGGYGIFVEAVMHGKV